MSPRIWLVANRQNRLEWLLLWAEDWAEFANSTERQQRQKIMTTMAREVGVGVGADVPIAEEQQHAWRMIVNFGDMASVSHHNYTLNSLTLTRKSLKSILALTGSWVQDLISSPPKTDTQSSLIPTICRWCIG